MPDSDLENDLIKEEIERVNDVALTADGFDDALIGYVERFSMHPVALYDRKKCIEILEKQGMTKEEAYEYFDYNVIGAWMGKSTPAFATILRGRKDDERVSH